MDVRDVMTRDPVVVGRDESLQRAVGEMRRRGIGSVLVGEDDLAVNQPEIMAEAADALGRDGDSIGH